MDDAEPRVGLSVGGLALGMTPDEAAESRVANFLFTCDGTNKVVVILFGGLAN